jgi:hypothetical protein
VISTGNPRVLLSVPDPVPELYLPPDQDGSVNVRALASTNLGLSKEVLFAQIDPELTEIYLCQLLHLQFMRTRTIHDKC